MKPQREHHLLSGLGLAGPCVSSACSSSVRVSSASLLAAVLLLGCAAQPPLADAPRHADVTAVEEGSSPDVETSARPRAQPHAARHQRAAWRHHEASGEKLASANVDFHALRLSDDSELAPHDFWNELSRADLICFGERHDAAADHAIELQVLRSLLERAQLGGRALGVGLELFPRAAQRELGGYLLGELSEKAMLTATHYREHWGYDFGLYRPIFELARQRRLPLLALNASRELVQQVALGGLQSLDADMEAELPELELHDKRHREIFDYAMRAHPAQPGSHDAAYAAQVVWDETMANSASAWLGERRPARQMLLIAGVWHCQKTAIPARVKRRLPLRVVSVLPVQPAEELDPVLEDSFDYAFMVTGPEHESGDPE